MMIRRHINLTLQMTNNTRLGCLLRSTSEEPPVVIPTLSVSSVVFRCCARVCMSPPPPLVDVSHDLSFLWHEPSKHGLNAANTWHQLGLVLATIDRNEEALSALHMALEIRRNQLGDCDLVAISLEALGDEYSKIYQLTGEKKAADEADQGYFESIRIREKICGHHSVVANVLFKQADLKRRLSD
eukprot:CAMPEP_0178691700 /NCGR_PEP_ID=MMETSP0699-20121125/6798_1 /TAXON_ID=265572 /ORGANISM="Extubocellulus spinifer, Strain CCMP396" /LENGTH=184 /DNA_ID=CAMNT_0020337021 /DNA_START=1 /DNA_END=552 /DNA_ORIENTATION=-